MRLRASIWWLTMAKRGRPPPDPEAIRRVCERRRGGESLASIAKDFGVTEPTISRWVKQYGKGAADRLPPAMKRPPPAPADSPDELADALERVVDALSDQSLVVVVRRVQDALRAGVGAAEDGDMPPDVSEGSLAWCAWHIQHAERQMFAAEARHDSQAARQYASNVEKWGKTYKMLEAQHAGSDGVVSISRSDVGTMREDIRALLKSYTASPPTCSECNRRIRVSWAKEDEE